MQKKKQAKKISARKPAKTIVAPVNEIRVNKSRLSYQNLSIYVYWFIILFFIGATFYIIGRGQEMLKHAGNDNVEVIADSQQRNEMAAEYLAAGKSKLISGDANGALSDLSIAIEALPTVDGFIYRGEAFMQLADYDNALSDFESALAISKGNAVAYYDKALIEIKLENYAAALQDIAMSLQLLEKSPNDIINPTDLYAKGGELNLWLKNYDAAIANYTSAIAGNSENIDYYANRGEAYMLSGQLDGAAADYSRGVQLVAEQIKNARTDEEKSNLSRGAISFFEKIAAIRVQTGDKDGARTNLEAALTIANALGDSEYAARLQNLITEL
jgi:tetratricopeptide (TPR) repeat protein